MILLWKKNISTIKSPKLLWYSSLWWLCVNFWSQLYITSEKTVFTQSDTRCISAFLKNVHFIHVFCPLFVSVLVTASRLWKKLPGDLRTDTNLKSSYKTFHCFCDESYFAPNDNTVWIKCEKKTLSHRFHKQWHFFIVLHDKSSHFLLIHRQWAFI